MSHTAQELRVVRLMDQGLAMKQVAASLGRSIKTASTHKTNLQRKLGVPGCSDFALFRALVKTGHISL